jgi:hypothetical protein
MHKLGDAVALPLWSACLCYSSGLLSKHPVTTLDDSLLGADFLLQDD